ncbi:MAG: 50S ribosomal protein L15 [Leptolyngbya sp. PLA3]|nr:MAG: 50S ribosomal protein L15 [Cyanobacteria bacterium CYA]MCE7969102.1 50S ribosomal protein L15 [Leptolyngbya sp. PL-A3]
MMIHEITEQAGRSKARKRIGRGKGSGTGKRSGRGQKGAGARSGNSQRYSFEGGQMPYFRRLPKMGFSNAKFRSEFWIVNLGDILKHESFARGGRVNAELLIAAGLVRDTSRDLKILGGLYEGQRLSVKLDVQANRVTSAARKAIEEAGGSVIESGTRRDRVRGVDRNAEDKSPKNQTKKAKRRHFQQAKAEAASRGEVLKKK